MFCVFQSSLEIKPQLLPHLTLKCFTLQGIACRHLNIEFDGHSPQTGSPHSCLQDFQKVSKWPQKVFLVLRTGWVILSLCQEPQGLRLWVSTKGRYFLALSPENWAGSGLLCAIPWWCKSTTVRVKQYTLKTMSFPDISLMERWERIYSWIRNSML